MVKSVAIAGADNEGRRIAKGYLDARFNIAAVWDPDPEKAKSLAGETGAECAASLGDILSNGKVQAVEVATPLDRRCQDAVEALKAGKPVSLRGPVANSMDEAEKLRAAAGRPGAKFRYLDPVHHHKPHAAARKMIRNGEISTVNGINIKVAASDTPPFSSSGICEPLDRLALVRWFIGEPEEVETIRSESASVTILKMGRSHCFGNFEAIRTPGLKVPFAQRNWDETIEVTGLTGIIWVNGFWGPVADRPPLSMRRYKRLIHFGADLEVDPAAAYARAAYVFFKALEKDIPIQPGIEDGLADLKLLLAADESARKGGHIKV